MIEALMVEDDKDIALLLTRFLEENGVVITHVIKPSDAFVSLATKKFDIVILDLSLPEMDGLVLCKKIREISEVGIIISTARHDINDKLIALDDGADDYLPKPYDPRELLARIKVIIQRKQGNTSSVNHGDFVLDMNSTQIFLEGKPLNLTRAEFEILKLFITRENQTISRVDIANSIDSHRYDSGVDSINVLIARLRKKIEKTGKEYIHTVRGMGYRFVQN